MPGKRTHLILPEELLAEIDALVGQRWRSAFLVDVLREEVRRRRLLQMLDDPEPIWKDEDHPELAGGSETWVRKTAGGGRAACPGKIGRVGPAE
jgi:hypothetical protein